MGQEPSDIRAEIEMTRARVGDEVDALSYKTDVPARVGDYVDDKRHAVTGRLAGARDSVVGATQSVLPTGERVGRVKDTAERNPLGLVVGGAALGFLAGILLPSTRIEDERMGDVSDRMVDAVRETAGEAVESGRHVAQDVAEGAMSEGKGLASSLQDRAQEATGSSPAPAG
jgi:hypothetical protein